MLFTVNCLATATSLNNNSPLPAGVQQLPLETCYLSGNISLSSRHLVFSLILARHEKE
jgi:hypothetical protein